MSLVSWETPWKPATIGIAFSRNASWMRPGVTSTILALPCVESVINPACDPVYERASKPRSFMAMAKTAIEIRSPAVSNISSSRPGGFGETCLARSIKSSVVSPIAETTTTTSLPARLVSTIRLATRKIPGASETDDPPNFATIKPIAIKSKCNCVVASHCFLAKLGMVLWTNLAPTFEGSSKCDFIGIFQIATDRKT